MSKPSLGSDRGSNRPPVPEGSRLSRAFRVPRSAVEDLGRSCAGDPEDRAVLEVAPPAADDGVLVAGRVAETAALPAECCPAGADRTENGVRSGGGRPVDVAQAVPPPLCGAPRMRVLIK